MPCKILGRFHTVLAQIYAVVHGQWYMYIPVPHLDLVDISQNMSATVRLMGTSNPMKKIQISWFYSPVTHTFLEMWNVSAPLTFFSFWHYIPLDSHWINHSYKFWLPNPWDMQRPPPQKITCSWFMRKPSIAKILRRRLLVGKKVIYKFPNDIASKLSNLHAVNQWFMCRHQNGQLLNHSSETGLQKKKTKNCSVGSHVVTHLCQFMVQNFKIWGVKKLDNILTAQKS